MIIDCHVHLNQYKYSKNNLSLQERLKALLDIMAANNINYSIIVSSYKVNMHRPSTAQILELTIKEKEIIMMMIIIKK